MSAHQSDSELAVLRCWQCDAQQAPGWCSKCHGSGSLFWANGRGYPYTPEGEKHARAAAKNDVG
jgi:hypothetical protein